MPSDATTTAAADVTKTAVPQGFDIWQVLIHHSSLDIKACVFGTLVVCSVWSIAVIIERWIILRNARKSIERNIEQLDEWGQAQQWDDARAAIEVAERDSQPLFSVLRAGIAYWQELMMVGETRIEVMENMVESAVTRELKLVKSVFRQRLPVLANIASTAPFIGLFGTVVGIILTFNAIASKGNLGMDVVGSGIADALDSQRRWACSQRSRPFWRTTDSSTGAINLS